MRRVPNAHGVALCVVLLVDAIHGASAQQSCGGASATGGGSFRWPVTNPTLVAPVAVKFDYKTYSHPMSAEWTGSALSMIVPKDFVGGFELQQSPSGNGTSSEPEQYKLTRIELRKPGRAPEGIGQVLSHTLEMALVHTQVGGSYVANIVIPFEVSPSSTYDVLAPLVIGATLPTEQGQREPVLMSSAQSLNLNVVMQGAEFLHFWTQLPTDCGGLADARQFMRSKTSLTGQGTYNSLLDVFRHAPDVPPLVPPENAFLIGVCAGGSLSCASTVTPLNISAKLAEAQQFQSQAVQELRERKKLMDKALAQLANDTVGALQMATDARDNLRTAEQEMASVVHYTSNLEQQDAASKATVWDADAPKNTGASSSQPAASAPAPAAAAAASTPAAATSPSASASADTAAPASNQSAGASQTADAGLLATGVKTVSATCSSYGKSPADIITAAVQYPALGLLQALRFEGMATAPRAVRVHGEGDHLRVAAGPRESLGSLVTGGMARPLSYVDVRAPGQHAVDGRVADAEVQLVHVPAAGGAPSVAVAFRLNVDDTVAKNVGLADNGWLGSLLQVQPPGTGNVLEAQGKSPLAALHEGLGQGEIARYFRYDGTTTSPPCRPTEWYVVEEIGHIQSSQLAALRAALPAATSQPTLFSANLVTRDTQLLQPMVQVSGLREKSQSFLRRLQM